MAEHSNETGRTGSGFYRTQHALSLLLIITSAVLLAWLSQRYDTLFDWTANGRHSISDVSKALLSKADQPLTITAYASDNQELRTLIKEFVARFQKVKSDIHLEFINPIAVPEEVRSKGVTVDGELILHYQGRTEHVKSDREALFINALQRLLRGSDKWLAFVEGHGERQALGKANHDLSTWVNQLQARGLKTQPVNLAQLENIPDNTSILILSAARADYLPGEVAKIISYLNRGGNILWLMEPGELYGLTPLADALGLKPIHGSLIDHFGQLLGINDPTISIATETSYQPHPALQEFKLTTVFPSVVALVSSDEQAFSMQPLLVSGEHTWIETGSLKDVITFDEDSDILGPHHLMISLFRTVNDKEQRIIISGDGDFLSNTYIGNSGNLDLGLRLINWLSGDDDLISIPPRLAKDVHLELSDMSKITIIICFLLLLPLVFFVTGIAVGWRRRRM